MQQKDCLSQLFAKKKKRKFFLQSKELLMTIITEITNNNNIKTEQLIMEQRYFINLGQLYSISIHNILLIIIIIDQRFDFIVFDLFELL